MKKLILALCFSLCISSICFAQGPYRIFPENSLLTFQGMDDTSSPPIVKDGRAADMQNIKLDITGQASKRNGYDREVLLDTNVVGDDFEAVTGLYELYKSDGTRTKLAVNGDKVYSWDTSTKTDITSSDVIVSGITVSQDNQYVWATALDYAIATNGVDPVFQTDGTTADILTMNGFTNSGNFTAKSVIWWKNYLVFGNTIEAGTEHRTRVRWSTLGTINTYDDDDFVDVATLGGQQIEALATLYDDLYVFLTDSIYKVSLVGGTALINVSKVSEGVGCIAKNSVKTIGIGNTEGIIFLSRDRTINYFDGNKVQEISTNISTLMDDVYSVRMPYAVAVDDRVNSHYYLATTVDSAATNNLLLDFHYEIGEWGKHTQIDANAICVANDTNTDKRVYFGNYDSFVYILEDPDLNSDVAGEIGIFDIRNIEDTKTASGLIVLYDTSADLADVTGAIVRITAGTGVGEESVIAASAYKSQYGYGIVVVDSTMTATGVDSTYSIGDIDAYYTTKWYDTGVSTMRKNFGDLYVWSSTDTSSTMQIYYATDFSETINSLNLSSETSGSLWGTAIWGTSTWAGTATSLVKLPLNISGRFIKFKFEEDDIDEPMDLMGYSLLLFDLDAQ